MIKAELVGSDDLPFTFLPLIRNIHIYIWGIPYQIDKKNVFVLIFSVNLGTKASEKKF